MILRISCTVGSALALDVQATSQMSKDCAECPEMVVLPAGNLEMGRDGATHLVTLQSFAIGKFEVTQGQWQSLMGKNPSHFKKCGAECPVEQVSWDDMQTFIRKLNAKSCKKYRLPSEAQWEYACRAGARQKYCGSDDLDAVAWYGAFASPGESVRTGNSIASTNRVGQRQGNAWGLFDMSGNVREATQDCWRKDLTAAPRDGSAFVDAVCGKRVWRGSAWDSGLTDALVQVRSGDFPMNRSSDGGFRLAIMPSPGAENVVELNRFQEGPQNDAGEGTVLDTKTKRKWMMSDFGQDITWKEANGWCGGGGERINEWRLPTKSELAVLFDRSQSIRCNDTICHVSSEFKLTDHKFWTKERGSSRQAGFVDLSTGDAKLAPKTPLAKNFRALCITHT